MKESKKTLSKITIEPVELRCMVFHLSNIIYKPGYDLDE